MLTKNFEILKNHSLNVWHTVPLWYYNFAEAI